MQEQSEHTPSDATKRSMSLGSALFLAAAVAVVGFVAGTRSDELLAQVGGVFGVKTSTDTLDFATTQRVYQRLKANYDGELDEQALIDGASRGMVAAAGDPYTTFYDEEEANELQQSLSGTISGIGAEIGVRGDTPTILRVLSGSPAEQAGLKVSDQIVAVNDTVTASFDAAKTAELIRGEAGTSVKLVIIRDREEEEFTITRASVSDTSVDARVDGEIGILKIRRFDTDTAALARSAAQKFIDQDVRGVILDLRDNGGGYLDQSQAVAGLWLDDQVVVTERTAGEETETLRSTGTPILDDMPTVVLINASSASASEIVAGALRDHDEASLIGETSFGKGSVQQILDLSGGRQLKVTIARWYTPSGETISEKGITPDTKVELTYDDLNNGDDPQLDAALKQLAK